MSEERFDRLEVILHRNEDVLVRLAQATEDGFSAMTSYLGVVKAQLALLDSRMTLIENQMTEVLGRLRIIGEQLATHTHDEAA